MSTIATDTEQIIRCTHRYARGLDRFDPREALSAFAADAVWDASPIGQRRLEGAEELLEFFKSNVEAVAEHFHLVTNHIIEIDNPDAATGTNYVQAYGTMKTGAVFSATVLNTDRYVRNAEGWVIAQRTMTALTTPQLQSYQH